MVQYHLLAAISTLVLITLGQRVSTQNLTCAPATRLNSAADATELACCSDQGWYTSYSGIAGTNVTAGTARTYCGSSSNRTLDFELARTGQTWYGYCALHACPPQQGASCCLQYANGTAAPIPSPSPTPSPDLSTIGYSLARVQAPIYALYLCPHKAPSTALFGFNFPSIPPTTPLPTASATPPPRGSTPAQLLASCPEAPTAGTPLESKQSFNISLKSSVYAAHLTPDTPYILSILRKPSLGPVTLTISIALDGRPDGLIYDRRVITLPAPQAPAVAEPAAALQAAGRRLQGGGGGRPRKKSPKVDRTAAYSKAGFYRPLPEETLAAGTLVGGSLLGGLWYAGQLVYRSTNTSAPFLSSPRWSYLNTTLPNTVAYGLPTFYPQTFLQNYTSLNTSYGLYGRSVFREGATFQYLTALEWPAVPGGPACSACSSGACCQTGDTTSPSFGNSNWDSLNYEPTRRGTVLPCGGLLQDFLLDLPLYLPTNATSLVLTVHSIDASVSPSAPSCASPNSTADPRSPPLYITLLRADTPDFRAVNSTACLPLQSNATVVCIGNATTVGRSRSSSHLQLPASCLVWLLSAAAAAVVALVSS